MGHSSLALAEEAMLKGKAKVARYQAGRAATLLPRGSVGWLQSQDILQAARKK
jgi:predicted Zn-dependent protease